LAQHRIDVVLEDHRLEGSSGETHQVQEKSLRSQMCIDIREQRLVLVERHELDFGMDHERALQSLGGALQDHEFCALHVEFEKVDAHGLRDVVKALGFRAMPDASICRISSAMARPTLFMNAISR
jgi:hypothetical protein